MLGSLSTSTRSQSKITNVPMPGRVPQIEILDLLNQGEAVHSLQRAVYKGSRHRTGRIAR